MTFAKFVIALLAIGFCLRHPSRARTLRRRKDFSATRLMSGA